LPELAERGPLGFIQIVSWMALIRFAILIVFQQPCSFGQKLPFGLVSYSHKIAQSSLQVLLLPS
jgi:hypothetical protein